MTAPIRIINFISVDASDATRKQLACLVSHLQDDEFEPSVCCLVHRNDSAPDFSGFPVVVDLLEEPRGFDFRAQRALRDYVLERQPQVVHTWGGVANRHGRLAATRAQVPKVVAMEQEETSPVNWLDRWHDARLAKRTQRLVASTQHAGHHAIRAGRSPTQIQVVPHGLTVVSAPNSANKSRLHAALGLSPDTRIFAVVTPLQRSAHLEDAIWVASILQEIRNDAHVVIVGQGNDYRRLVQYARQTKTTPKVHFVHEMATDVWTEAEVLLSTGTCAASAETILQAMAAGMPVVATDEPPHQELVVPGETGFLVKSRDAADLARQVNKLLDDPTLAANFRVAAQNVIAQTYSVESMVQRYTAIYRKLVAVLSEVGG